jgi:hypothetical protein
MNKKALPILKQLGAQVNQLIELRGGPGSGNFGHGGRPGQVGGSGGGASAAASPGASEAPPAAQGIASEPTTAPPPGKYHKVDVEADGNKDGVTDAARVGVNAMSVPPPPPIARMPNLNAHEREAEEAFMSYYEKDPDGVANKFKDLIVANTKPGEPPTFGTDDAKVFSDKWEHPSLTLEQRSQNRATYNTPLHQTANAIAKRAFVNYLDTLQPGDEIMVTVGGCGAGKGFAISGRDKDGNPFVPEAMALKMKSKAVWDSAGDQNATENPWIQKEAEARGLKVNYVYVHADPQTQWAHPERGVVKRAGDPNDGRMVDAKVFADSYALGAKNHQAFYESNKSNPNANFLFLKNAGKPEKLPGIPKEALNIDRKALENFAVATITKTDAPPHVKRGALMGYRIWGED